MSFYVDIPQITTGPSQDDTWVNIAVVATRKEAEDLLSIRFGIAPEESKVFIVEGEADLKPAPWEVNSELSKT